MATRKEQKELRRQKILFTALELFVKKGYADTKIEDISSAAEMSAGLMFHYFSSKEQLCEELVRMGAGASETPRELEYSNPLDFFERFLRMLFSYAKEQPWVFYMFVLMSQVRRSSGIPQHIREIALSVNQIKQSAEIIRIGQEQGYFREGDAYALSFTFWSSVQGIMEQIAADPSVLTDEKKLPHTDWIIDIIRSRK